MTNSLWLAFSQFVGRGGSFLLMVLIARKAGEAILGQFSIIWTACALLFVFAEWGRQVSVTREISRFPENKQQVLGQALATTLIHGGIAAIVLAAIGYTMGKNGGSDGIIVLPFTLFLWLQAIGSALRGAFRAENRFHWETIVALIDKSSMLGIAAFFLSQQYGLIWVGVALATGQALGLLVTVIALCRASVFPGLLRHLNLAGTLDSSGLWLSLASLSAVAYVRSDILILGLFRSPQEVGSYAAAGNIMLLMGFLPQVVLWAWFPQSVRQNKSRIVKWLERVWPPLALCGVLISCLLISFRNPIFFAIYGPMVGAYLLPILASAEAVNFLNFSGGIALRSMNLERNLAIMMVLAAAMNIAANFIVVPEYGAKGAAYTTLAAYLMVAIGHAILSHYRKTRGILLVILTAFICLLWSYGGWHAE